MDDDLFEMLSNLGKELENGNMVSGSSGNINRGGDLNSYFIYLLLLMFL